MIHYPPTGDLRESPRSRPHDPDCDPNDATFSRERTDNRSTVARSGVNAHGKPPCGCEEQRGNLFRVMVNNQMFRETTLGSAYAEGVARGLVEGWKGLGHKNIPLVTVQDDSGKEVWSSKEQP